MRAMRATLPDIVLSQDRLPLMLIVLSGLLWSRGLAADLFEQRTTDLPGEMNTMQGEVSFQALQRTEEPVKQAPKQLNFGDALRTHALSRATVTITNGSDIYLSQMTRLAIVAVPDRPNLPALDLRTGRARFISRGGPASTLFQSPTLSGSNRGTEFLIEVEPGGTVLTVFEGEAEVGNADTAQPVRIRSGQQAIALSGRPIEVRAVIAAEKIVQWWIYYPGILDPEELGLRPAEQADLAPAEQTQLALSLKAYREGNLVEALKQYPGYPEPADPASDARRYYLAGILLSVGAVDRSEALLSRAPAGASLARALRTMIRAVQTLDGSVTARADYPESASQDLRSSSERVARSYAHQATNNLEAALEDARAATSLSPEFGFGWARVAELEFSFGHAGTAHDAVQKAIAFTPHNAQAHALNGFLLAADNRTGEALEAFDTAIAIDPALGNAWLGRGLCKIRRTREFFSFSVAKKNGGTNGNTSPSALDDLRTAAALEPSRSLLRSYLGKAFAEAALDHQALKEFAVAKHLDTNDPTPWLYSALLHREEHRINEAARDLERSIALNDNRAVYRSRFRLDEDRAVRSANLADAYAQAGMREVSVGEAARSVTYEYANHSAHLFLAQSYDALRDPTRFNLRYETVWFNELLLANILAPVGAGNMSQTISQQEYTRLFQQDELGLFSSTDYRSDGQVRQIASQFGTFGNTSYALDVDYQHNEGTRPNNELERLEVYLTAKQQLTRQDSVFLLTKYENFQAGDNFQYYDPAQASRNFHGEEFQEPLLLGAYYREWSPGVHTLFAAARLINDQTASDQGVNQLLLTTNGPGQVTAVNEFLFDPFGNDVGGLALDYRSQFEIYSFELNQLLQHQRHTDTFGVRYQFGEFLTRARLFNVVPTNFAGSFADPPAHGSFTEDFNRLSLYGYHTWQIVDPLFVTAGLSYDQMTFPENYRRPPLSAGTDHRDQLSPKAALVWRPAKPLTFRGAYTRSLGGVSFDESLRLEPTQLAGFPQAFRTIISESAVGSVVAPKFDTAGAAVDLALPSGTYLSLQGDYLRSQVERTIGAFVFDGTFGTANIFPSSTRESLDYVERAAAVTLNQLIGREWSLGARYRFTRSELERAFDQISRSVLPRISRDADLHDSELFALFNHPSGFFARWESHWYHQENSDLPGEDFMQHNIFVGYRFWRQRLEMMVGGLNLTDQDYRLNPLTPYSELPRGRVLSLRMKLQL